MSQKLKGFILNMTNQRMKAIVTETTILFRKGGASGALMNDKMLYQKGYEEQDAEN